MKMLYRDGTTVDWPEWANSVPQADWTNEQIDWMVKHQDKVLRLDREAEQRLGDRDSE